MHRRKANLSPRFLKTLSTRLTSLPACRLGRLHSVTLLSISLVSLFSVAALQAADWPMYRSDNARSGFTAEGVTFPLSRSWVYEAPSAPKRAWSGSYDRVMERKEIRDRVKFDDSINVAVAENRLYFGSSVDHQVHCRDANTGRPIWTFTTGGPIRLAPAVYDGRVFVGSDDGFAYCLDAASGNLVWKLRAGPPGEWLLARGEMISRWPLRTGIIVEDGVAYFGAGIFPHEDIYLYAVRADDGILLWKRDNISEAEAGRDDLTPQGYLLVSEHGLFVPSGRSLPAAINKQNGQRLFKAYHGWRRDAGGVVGGTKALLADHQLYTGGAHHFAALDQKTGGVGYGYIDGRQMAVDADSAYLANGERVVRRNRKESAIASRLRHKFKTDAYNIERKIRTEEQKRLKATAEEKAAITEALDELRIELKVLRQSSESIADMGIVWQTPSTLESSLIVAGEVAFAGGDNRVAGYDVASGKEIWSSEVDGEARGLAVADGKLFVSTTTGKIYAFAGSENDSAHAAAKLAQTTTESPYPNDELSEIYSEAAQSILEQTGVQKGFCLVVGNEKGRLAYELARHSALKIYAIEPDPQKVSEARKALTAAGLYGHRVTVHEADFAEIPYSNYFANLIVSDTLLLTGRLSGDPAAVSRHLKPMGGVICFGVPQNFPAGTVATSELRNWLDATQLGEQATVKTNGPWTTLTRGKLPGAGEWTHLYGDAGNTASSDDRRIKGGLGVLWYGDPGPGEMVNRHDGAVGPLAVNGKLFVQGANNVMAYDAYNGQFLWERGNEEAQRTGVFLNYNPGNLVASPDRLFVMVKDQCLELNADTGEVEATHTLPDGLNDKQYEWGYLAYHDGLLYGTATIRKEIEQKLRRRGRVSSEATDAIFAIDTETGEHRWTYQGGSISHHTIALGPERVFFIDSSITSEQRAALLGEDKAELKELKGEEAKTAEQRIKEIDARLTVALDARTGEKLWSVPVDVTDCSEIGIGGGQLTLMYHNNVLVLCGANANGHYWKQFLAGEFKRRRLVALSAEDGHRLWAKDANYRHRPIVVEDQIIAEPWGFDLYTGAQKMRNHPLTGEPVPWSIIRPGHHCGMLTGCPSMLTFRSGFTGFYDLEEDSGTRHFAGHRLGCWINAIPANGLVMIPEASAGCVCLFSISSTVTLEPRKARRPWTIYSAVGPKTPVKHMALNFGAPGDRRDAHGTIWLAYPRPKTSKQTGLDLIIDLKPKFLKGGGFDSRSNKSTRIENADTSWLFTSAARGLTDYTIPLLDKDSEPARYNVTLYFAELDDAVKPGERMFDVELQGETVLKNLDVMTEAGGKAKPLVRTIENVAVSESLAVKLVPHDGKSKPLAWPMLNAMEVERVD